EVYKPGKPKSLRLIRKIGFCLVDLVRQVPAPANAAPRRYTACGHSRNDKAIDVGISVGWADDYQPLIANQWIDVTGLRKGLFRLCAKVNPLGEWLESNMDNNYFWYDIWMNPARSRLEIRGSGRSACGSFAP
ncbi:MAG TPA: lysyl oxidase family protein, partial [Candidatus Limnocylindrales bacterium]